MRMIIARVCVSLLIKREKEIDIENEQRHVTAKSRPFFSAAINRLREGNGTTIPSIPLLLFP
jgi:hypothetical protein